MLTFHKDVAPILQKSCQGCHRAGEAAPHAPGNLQRSPTLGFGDQSWEEMMFGFFDVAVDAKLTVRDLLPKRNNGAPKPSDVE